MPPVAAAAAGGFTDVCAMPNTRPVNDSRAVTELLVHKARALGGSRLHPIAAITVGQRGDALTEMADLRDGGAVAVSDDGRCVTRSDVMRRALEYASTFDMPVIQHAEDHALIRTAANLIPREIDPLRVIDIVGLDKQADGGTHVLSTAEVGAIAVTGTESKGKGNKRVRIEVRDG